LLASLYLNARAGPFVSNDLFRCKAAAMDNQLKLDG
jgi:hypothetical protein